MKHKISIEMALKEETYRKVDLDGIVNPGYNNNSELEESPGVNLQLPNKMSNENGYQLKNTKDHLKM